jgi:RNA polymerase sigma-70 factor (ECF subfamily)
LKNPHRKKGREVAGGSWNVGFVRATQGDVVKRVPSSDVRFRSLYEKNYADVRAFCLRRLATDEANDAAAEIFIIAWRKLAKVPEGKAGRLWLYGVARNVVAHQHRSRSQAKRLQSKLQQTAERLPYEPVTETVVVRRSQDEAVLTALDRLKSDERELVRLKMWEELTHAEIGEVFGISAHAVDMRVQRVGKKLAKLLELKRIVRPHPITKAGEL